MLGVVDGHGLDVAVVHAAVADLGPAAPLLALLGAQLVDGNAAVHAAREDGLAVGAGDEVQAVGLVAGQTLGQAVCAGIPDLDLAVRVCRDNGAVGQTLDAPDQGIAGGAGDASAQTHVAEHAAIAGIEDADGAVGEAGDDGGAGLPGQAHAAGLARGGAGEEALEDEVVVGRRQQSQRAVATANDQVLAAELAVGRGGRGGGSGRRLVLGLSPSWLGGKTPHLAEVARRRPLDPARGQIPLRHGRRGADAEEAHLSQDRPALRVCLVRLLDPGQGVDAPVIACREDDLLHPGALVAAPDFYVAIGSAQGQLQGGLWVRQVLVAGA